MSIFENFEKKLQAEPKSIVFTEGTDARILSAASRLLAGKTLKVILLGEVEAVKKAAADGSFDITGAEIIDPANYEGFDEMVAKMVELRKGKMTDEQCRAALSKGNYFGTMLVKQGKADCLLGGATYSTKGSGKGETVDKMRNATARVQEAHPELKVDGELQFDAAVAPEVGQLKAPGSKVAGYANTFIFPNINAGNIGYKIAQRLGGFEAYGPILQGLNASINDLSRGCNAEEVYKMALITAALI